MFHKIQPYVDDLFRVLMSPFGWLVIVGIIVVGFFLMKGPYAGR